MASHLLINFLNSWRQVRHVHSASLHSTSRSWSCQWINLLIIVQTIFFHSLKVFDKFSVLNYWCITLCKEIFSWEEVLRGKEI